MIWDGMSACFAKIFKIWWIAKELTTVSCPNLTSPAAVVTRAESTCWMQLMSDGKPNVHSITLFVGPEHTGSDPQDEIKVRGFGHHCLG